MDYIRRLWNRGGGKVGPNRFIFAGHAVPEQAEPPPGYDRQKFPDNEVTSSKYTLWNFLPKNLFEQFRRIANFYFLCAVIITLLTPNSPVSPLLSLLPLIFVVVVTGIKQAYEDYLRHKSDRQVNQRLIDVVRNGHLTKIKSKHIHVGDILRIEDDDSFPCDLILLSSSNPEGKCYVTTANLDGETNYKIKNSPKLTRELDNPEKLDSLRAHLEYQQPTVNLYQFVGTLTVYNVNSNTSTCSLGLDNLLLRGARLKDTDFIYGCVVYTGQDTKLGLNSLLTSNKFSTVEKSMNYFLLVFLGILAIEIGLCTMQKYLYLPLLEDALYMGEPLDITASGVFQDLAAFLIMFSYIIPISLYVTLELQKFFGSMFFAWDQELYCPIADEPAICNTSDLNEELGQVQFLLTDKTGTLTENYMQFRQCSINGRKYLEKNGVLMKASDNSALNLERVSPLTSQEEMFFIALGLCHTVNIVGVGKRKKRHDSIVSIGVSNKAFDVEDEDYEYQASSPDEKALVEACQRFGVIYSGEEDEVCTIRIAGRNRHYCRLHILEFDSDRKRMSVIIQYPDESIWLICKGAESTVLPRCNIGFVSETEQHIKDYALLGLRTLAIAARKLSPEEYDEIRKVLDQAHQALTDREGEVAKAFDAIEKDLTLLGATGVEDKLQEAVQETLESLKAAGIIVWILTGDKLETAVNIAFSCGHFQRGMEMLELSGLNNVENTLIEFGKQISGGGGRHFGLVIDGLALTQALSQHRNLLAEVAVHCKAVVCCRMSPIQKAEVVKLVKSFPGKPITAAIGDGANDVSMIQEAHIGLGIMGKEGRQAVRCSDFAFARFHFLRRVLLVHGHWYYWRVSTLVQYFFYKNITFITPAVWFCTYSAYSTLPLYDGFFLTYYNLFFTALPILIFGLLEQNFSDKQLLKNLHIYRDITGNARMSWKQFFKWNLLGLWHAAVVYFGAILLFDGDPAFLSSGTTLDYRSFGTLIYHNIVFIVTIKLVMESRHWSIPFWFSVFFAVILVFMCFTFFYCGVTNDQAFGNGPMQWIYMVVLSTGPFWYFMVLSIVGSLLPDLLISIWETHSAGDGIFVRQNYGRLLFLRHIPTLIISLVGACLLIAMLAIAWSS